MTLAWLVLCMRLRVADVPGGVSERSHLRSGIKPGQD